LLLFLMLTGCRVAEATDLLWKDIDFDQVWLVFRKTKRNEEARGVPIHLQLVDVLRQLCQTSGNPKVDTPVFQTHQGQPYADHDRESGGQVKTAWNGACRRAGIVELHLHDLRHTFATWALRTGIADRVRKEILGTRRAIWVPGMPMCRPTL
jgi:integrase